MAAKKYIDDGKLGKIHFCRVYNQKRWGNFPAVPDSDPPKGLDWDMWNGPAPEAQVQRAWHQSWHHFWRYSGGDIVNDASHQIDLARWLLGVDYPKSVYSTGGRFAFPAAAETPDTQIALFDFDKLAGDLRADALYRLHAEDGPVRPRQRHRSPTGRRTPTRIEIFGTEAMMIVGRHGGGWQVFDRPKDRTAGGHGPDERPVPRPGAQGELRPVHPLARVAQRRHRQGPPDCLMIHYGNISYRLGGQKLAIDPKTEHVKDSPEAEAIFKRTYRSPYVIPDEV